MKYTVKDTHIRHSEKTYGPGSVMELTEEEATPLLHHLELVEDAMGPAIDSENSTEEKKGRRK